jgi:hypothetical protein
MGAIRNRRFYSIIGLYSHDRPRRSGQPTGSVALMRHGNRPDVANVSAGRVDVPIPVVRARVAHAAPTVRVGPRLGLVPIPGRLRRRVGACAVG